MMVHIETAKVSPDDLKIEKKCLVPLSVLAHVAFHRASSQESVAHNDFDCACILETFAAFFTCFPSSMVGNILPRPFETSKAAGLPRLVCLPNTLCNVGGGVFRPCLADVQVQQQQSAVHAVVAQGRNY